MRAVFLAVVLVACGGKVDGNVEGGVDDASPGVDARDPPPTIRDAGTGVVDAGMVGCTAATVAVGISMDGCKMNASWSCGADKYEVGTGCSQLTGLSGSCVKNGVPTKMIVDKSCNCQDPQVAKLLAKLCGFPPPP